MTDKIILFLVEGPTDEEESFLFIFRKSPGGIPEERMEQIRFPLVFLLSGIPE